MITLKEYAEKKHVSYEVIRRDVNRFRKELGEHLLDGKQNTISRF